MIADFNPIYQFVSFDWFRQVPLKYIVVKCLLNPIISNDVEILMLSVGIVL